MLHKPCGRCGRVRTKIGADRGFAKYSCRSTDEVLRIVYGVDMKNNNTVIGGVVERTRRELAARMKTFSLRPGVTQSRHVRVLCVDPSIRALGWAVFEGEILGKLRVTGGDGSGGGVGGMVENVGEMACGARLMKSGVIRVRDGDWIEALDDMVLRVEGLVRWCESDEPVRRCDVVVIEQPDHYSGGVGEAARNSSAILKLMGLVFAIREMARRHTDAFGESPEVVLAPVRAWKGTTPKKITQLRVGRWWGWEGKDHNEADAVGIGDWYMRKECGYTPGG